jgi:predicted NAD/FAD-dependent oxidoreductase
VLPAPLLVRTQLWGAALPTNTPDIPCIWDARARVGVCGDWVAGKGRMQEAALSGVAMAQRIYATRGAGLEEAESLGLGLEKPFKKL